MKLFAITPDACTCSDIDNHLVSLRSQGVSFLYVRSPLLEDRIEQISAAAGNLGIVPVIPLGLAGRCRHLRCGIHIKSSRDMLPPETVRADAALVTASCHAYETALHLLIGGAADYVFISPVFTPFSKPHDTRRLFPRAELKRLIARFGERIVVLGGLNRNRIRTLRKEFGYDFSVAGTTMFFGQDVH